MSGTAQGPGTSPGSGSWCLTLPPWQRTQQVPRDGDSTDSFPMRSASFCALLGKKEKNLKIPFAGNSVGPALPLTGVLIRSSFLWVQHHFEKVTSDRRSQGKHPFEDEPSTYGNSCPDLDP